MDKQNQKIRIAVLLLGFSSITAQIVLIREFLTVFYGNEMSLGYMLSAWLIGSALGSWLLGGIADKLKKQPAVFSYCQLLLSGLLLLSIFAVRYIKVWFHLAAGQVIAFTLMLLSSFLILVPLCALFGFMFAFACRLYEQQTQDQQISSVYILEALGSMLGGLLVSFFLIKLLQPLDIMLGLAVLNVISALYDPQTKKSQKPVFFIGIIFSALILVLPGSGLWGKLQADSLAWQWKGLQVISFKNSIYGNIVVTARDEQRSFFYNGLHLYTVPDKKTAEESVHFALLAQQNPKEVLLIGAGISGAVEEILRHPVAAIDYVELDAELIAQAEKYLSAEQYFYLHEPKVRIHYADGRFFVKNSKKQYDCIILDVGNPYTAQINRYYTVEFFQEIKHCLTEQGIFALNLSSSESYINQDLQDFLASIYKSLNQVFPEVKVIPGDKACFLAAARKDSATNDYQQLSQRAADRQIELQYVRDYYLFNRLAADKIKRFIYVLESASRIKTNHDFRPISYYYDMVFWAGHFKDSLARKILIAASEKKIWLAVLLLSVFMLALAFRQRQKQLFYKQAVLTAVFMTGFAEMSFQMITLLCFQVIYGYVFYKLGLILTAFMIGLVCGAVYIKNILPGLDQQVSQKKFFLAMQIAVCIYPLILLGVFLLLARSASLQLAWLGANIIFPCLPMIAGFIGGMQFPLANKICLGHDFQEVGRIAGLNYGADLFGACLGALLCGTFFIPILGIPKTCVLVSILNAVVLIMLVMDGKNKARTIAEQ